GQERLPDRLHRGLVRPGKHVHELELLAGIAFPHVDDRETMPLHDRQRMILEACMEGVPIAAIDLVDPQLVQAVAVCADVAILRAGGGRQTDKEKQCERWRNAHGATPALATGPEYARARSGPERPAHGRSSHVKKPASTGIDRLRPWPAPRPCPRVPAGRAAPSSRAAARAPAPCTRTCRGSRVPRCACRAAGAGTWPRSWPGAPVP